MVVGLGGNSLLPNASARIYPPDEWVYGVWNGGSNVIINGIIILVGYRNRNHVRDS